MENRMSPYQMLSLPHRFEIPTESQQEEEFFLFKNETKRIISSCIEVHNELGNGFLEGVYQEALEEEFKLQKIPYEREKLLPVMYKGKKLAKEYFADFVCFNEIIVELKAVSVLSKPHKAQLLNYLNAAHKKIGLLINFGTTSLKWERVSNFSPADFA